MTTTHYLLPTREPPSANRVKAPPWPPPVARITENQNKIHKSEIQTTMKKDRKKQEDRLLKHLSLRERQRQVQLRQMIAQDPLFLVV
jgi:hypothetical protein